MAIWPFRRRSNRENAHTGAAEKPLHERVAMDPGRHNGSDLSSGGPERRRSRRDKKRNSSRESKKLQRDPRRTYSFSPGRHDSIRFTRDQDRPPVPRIPIDIKGQSRRPQSEDFGSAPTVKKYQRASTQSQEILESTQVWERVPTLHKRSAQEMARRKSSKKRKEEHIREAEIKQMAAFMPVRPAADAESSGRLLTRETRKMRSGLVSHSKSDISLPFADSVHSSLSGSEHQASFKLSAFDMLAPRPTIRFSEPPRYGPGPNGFGSDRSDSKRRRASERIPEETLEAHKRIDDLADDLDAWELRQLMERDQNRREKKKIADSIKAEKKLARRQQKQKEEEATAERDGTPPPVNMDRGVYGRDVVGLGIGTSAVVTSSKRKGSTGSEGRRGKRPADNFRHDSTASSTNPPLNFHRSASLVSENVTPTSEREEPVIETAKVGMVAKASVSPTLAPKGHARGASSISQMIDLGKAEAGETGPRESFQKTQTASEFSESSAKGRHSSWTSFFKRSSKPQRGSTPSSFSNTSRDSMHAQGPQIGYSPMKSTSNIPKRTMSKFREDLPELPLSPPDSRVQSPEAHAVPPTQTSHLRRKGSGQIAMDDSRPKYDLPASGYRSIDAMRLRDETSMSGRRSADSPEPAAVLSQSLASIDSEGSWLSGRRAGSKRGSAQAQHYPARDSANSLQRRLNQYSDSTEEIGIAEDEYFSRLSPEPESEHKQRPSGAPMPSSDEEEGSIVTSPAETTTWGAVGRHPTVVHREPSAKSREGLLNDFRDGLGDELGDENDLLESTNKERRRSFGFDRSVMEDEEPRATVSRATSIDLGKGHVRRISAGSARLLDLKPRASQDSKRISSG